MDALPQRTWRATVLGACVLAAIASTWPLALHLATAVPLGTESAATIPLFDIWTLWWAGGRLWHGFSDLWNAPIFHPTTGAFAFSEPMLLPGALVGPLVGLRAPPALAHNLVLLAILGANGIAGCRVARAFGVGRGAALLAGIMMVTLPFFAKLQGELPILAITGTLVALDGVARFAADGRVGAAVESGVGLIIQAASCQQLTPFAFLFVSGAAVVALRARGFSRGGTLRLAGAFVVAGLVVWLLARTPLAVHRQQGFRRTEELVQSLSATPLDFLTRPLHALMPFPSREDATTFTGGLFPGILLSLLAVAGAVVRGCDAEGKNPWRWYALGGAVAGVLLALGPNLSIFGWPPFSALRALPGFDQIRSVYRLAVFAQVNLVFLAAFGLDALGCRLKDRPHANQIVLAAGLLAAAENLSLPAPLLAVPRSPRTAWTAFVAAQPTGTVLAHVPFPAGPDVEDFAVEAWRLYAQLDHGQPLANGYASNFPAVYREFMFAMGAAFPKQILACALRTVFHADLLVVDQSWLSVHRSAFDLEVMPLLAPAYADATVAIYRLQPPPDVCPPMRIDVGGR
jgi:hypothetical protein